MADPRRPKRPTVASTTLRRDTTTILSRVQLLDERIIVTRGGKELAVLVPLSDLQRLEEIDALAADQTRAHARFSARVRAAGE